MISRVLNFFKKRDKVAEEISTNVILHLLEMEDRKIVLSDGMVVSVDITNQFIRNKAIEGVVFLKYGEETILTCKERVYQKFNGKIEPIFYDFCWSKNGIFIVALVDAQINAGLFRAASHR